MVSKIKMEADTLSDNHPSGFLHRSLPAVVPMLLISIGYVDPGKWVATVEGGARYFGFDLMVLMLIFNFAAIFCQYLSASVAVITGKNLAQICSDEYDTWTCMLLGIQTELSVIMLDLNMILGFAHGLNLIIGWDLLTCVFLTTTGAVFHILLAAHLDIEKAKILSQFLAAFVLISFILGLLMNQPEIRFSINGVLTKLSGESAFVLMSLLGANIVPYNFYLHSSIIQWHQGLTRISKNATCHNHFLAVLCVFSGLYLVNNMLMAAAANEFNSMGPVLLTFQDSLSAVEQVLRSPIALFSFLLILFLANQTMALSWSLGGEVIVNGFLKLDIPGWLHYATVRGIAVLPALYCVWSSGAEGMYHLLIFTQVLVALQLPSSVIPLFRVATSRSIMGVHKISPLLEFFALIIFIGMLGLNIVFVVEMIFGNSDWVSDLRWNVGTGVSVSYLVLLTSAFTSLSLMLWLAAIPLRSASVQLDAQYRHMPETVPNPPLDDDKICLTETRSREGASVLVEKLNATSALARTLEYSDVSRASFLPVPDTISEPDPHVNAVRENLSNMLAASTSESEAVSTDVGNEISDSQPEDTEAMKMEAVTWIAKTTEVEGDSIAERDDDNDGDSWETEESSRVASASVPSSISDGPASFRSLTGKSDEGGNSFGSLSRVAGLGRAARRQLTTVLDEFWGQIYDFHGQATHEAKARIINLMFGQGVDSRPTSFLQKMDASVKDYSEYVVSLRGRTSDTSINSSPYDSFRQPRMRSNSESSCGLRSSSSSMQENAIELLDAYVQSSRHNVVDSGERRYFSVGNVHSSEAQDYQPATIHGYQTASYLCRVSKDRSSDNLNGPMDMSSLKSPSMGNTNYRDSLAFALGKKLHSGSGVGQPPGFQNVAVSRNFQLQSERSYYDSSGLADNTVNTKKYHSLPDISGYSIPQKAGCMSDKSAAWNGPAEYGFPCRACYEYFKFKNLHNGSGVGRPDTTVQETSSFVDVEGKILQSVRLCIVKLLKLEGSDWLFRQNGGADEDLIDRVAAREKFVYEVETREMNQTIHMGEARYFCLDSKSGSSMKSNEASSSGFSVSSVPNCGEGCIWRSDLIISFGVWCIHRVLNLSLVESRPDLWGKYTYVLNRLQGIIEPAFFKPRSPFAPCFCLQVPTTHQQNLSPPLSDETLPQAAAKPGRGNCTTASTLLELIKDVELAISSRKGRTGTSAGDVAFPKGKANLASVLKRYKRKLSNTPIDTRQVVYFDSTILSSVI